MFDPVFEKNGCERRGARCGVEACEGATALIYGKALGLIKIRVRAASALLRGNELDETLDGTAERR
jgi:hypothetical protein